MVTAAIQVAANTQQAVGAFNALAASINTTTTAVQRMNTAMQQGQARAASLHGVLTRGLTGGFEALSGAISKVIHLAQLMWTGLAFSFGAVLRELDKLQGFAAIMSVTTKSTDAAAVSYDFLRGTADRLGVQFDGLATNYAKLVAAIPPGVNQLNIANKAFLGLSMASRTLHSSNTDTQLMFYAMTQMASKGVVSMEELRRQLGEKLPGVMSIAAKSLSTTVEEFEKAVRKGLVNSEKFISVFGDALIRTFGDSAELASQSVSASLNRLKNVWVDFVKEILDSGAGQAIVGVFDALREKLSDPYLIERFAQLIKDVSDRFAEMIRNITSEDIRKGFDLFYNGINILVTAIGGLIKGLTWVINNAPKAGAILGAVGGGLAGMGTGALAGSAFGGIGAAPGAAIGLVAGAYGGAGAGYYAGSMVKPTESQSQAARNQDLAAQTAALTKKIDEDHVKYNMLIPMLQNFKGLSSFKDLDKLFQSDRLTQKTILQLNQILTDPRYKTDAQRATGVRELAKYSEVLGPDGVPLSSVLNTKGKVDTKALSHQRSLDSSLAKAQGLNPDYAKEMANYNELLAKGKMNQDLYNSAVQDLIQRQPYMIEYLKNEKDAQETLNEYRGPFLDSLVRQITLRDDLNKRVDDEIASAGLRSDVAQIEARVNADLARFKEDSFSLGAKEIDQLREKYRLIESIKQVTAAEQQVLAATVDKWLPQITMLKGIDKALADPTSGLTQQSASDFIVNQDPNAQGSNQWIDAQRRSTEEYYLWVDLLRQKDLVSEQTAQQMKAKASIQYDQIRLGQASEFFGNLATLSQSGNSRIARIGKMAAVASATIDGYVAVQKALASASPPVNYIMAAAVAIKTAANVAAINSTGGFYNGGYTGDSSRGSVSGVVHGQEFVVNASATSRNRAVLEAMNSGANVASQGSSGQPVTVIINNNADGTKVSQTERSTPTGKEIEVTIERVVVGQIRGGGRIADAAESQWGLNRAVGIAR